MSFQRRENFLTKCSVSIISLSNHIRGQQERKMFLINQSFNMHLSLANKCTEKRNDFCVQRVMEAISCK